MLLQDDTHQLTTCPDAGLGEELLKCGFDRTLRHSDSRCNLLIRKTLEHAGEDLLFPLGEWPCATVLQDFGIGAERGLQLLLVEPNFASHYVADSLRQQRSRVVFAKDSGNARADEF